LPGEQYEDLEALVGMARSVESICRVFGRRKRITVSLSPFVPRPHTPFQWERQEDPGSILRKISFIRKGVPEGRVKLKWRDPYMSLLEGLIARGNGSVGSLILAAWKAGSRFDGWTDRFDFSLWLRLLGDRGIEVDREIAEKDRGEALPWDHIDGGVSRLFLAEEALRSAREELTPDCRQGHCTQCGACDGSLPMPGVPLPSRESALAVDAAKSPRASQAPVRFRVKYAKREEMRLTSHLDVVRCIQRALRRAALPVCYSRGFSPHPRISFGPPLPLGVIGNSEYFDILLCGRLVPDWTDRLNESLPRGLEVLAGQIVAKKGPSLTTLLNAAEYKILIWRDGQDGLEGLSESIENAFSRDGIVFRTDHRVGEGKIIVDLAVGLKGVAVRPEKLVERVLREMGCCFKLIREGLYCERDSVLYSPFELDRLECGRR
jgi:radical SAM-linked protein